MPFTSDDIGRLTGATVWDVDGEKVGRIGQVYLDRDDSPSWATVRTGFVRPTESFFPLAQATLEERAVHLRIPKALLEQAPRVDTDEELTAAQSDELVQYYAGAGGTEPHRTTAVEPASGEASVTRSEERLQVGVAQEESGRVRLRRSVVAEQQTVTVTVRHEEATLIREPITAAERDDVPAVRELSEEEHVLVLHRDVVDTEKHVVPVERVRLGTRLVTEQRDVTADVQKEQIEVMGLEEEAR